MSGIICLAHVLCAVLYIRCSWHLFHSSVDLRDLTHALFPILGDRTIPQSSNHLQEQYYMVYIVPGRGLELDQPPGSLCATPHMGHNSDPGGR